MYKILILFLFVIVPAAARAQRSESDSAAVDVTILVNGVRQDVDGTGESVSVFERGAIEQAQGADLTRLIEHAPGVSVGRNGGPGSFTAVRVRGAEGEQLLVLVDGVKVADPAAPGGGFDLGNLLLGNLRKVELQRSSNSTIWGSDAIGGVLAVTSGGGPRARGSAEYGAYDTAYGTVGASFDVGPASFGLDAGHYRSEGFSSAAGSVEPDGFRQTELAGRARLDLADGLTAFARGRYADGRVDLDGFPAPAFTLADTAEYQDTEQRSGATGLRYANDDLELRATLSAAQTKRANYDPAVGAGATFTANGLSRSAELRGRFRIAPQWTVDFGGERQWTRFSTLFDAERRTAITGIYGQVEFDGGPLQVAAGLRRDDHRDFGGQWSFGADVGYDLSSQWRVSASYGEGFKAPTLFQLHSDYGNAALQPESSRSYDLGLAYRGPITLKLTAFRRDTRNLIGFIDCFGITKGICANRLFGTYDNIGQARAQGVEFEGSVRPTSTLQLGAAYTYLEAIDRAPGSPNRGKDLARRPHHLLTLSGDWRRGDFGLGTDLRVVSDSFDDPANAIPLEGYAVLTVRGEWNATQEVTLYARIENALDERYQTAAGYATAGRSAYVGARARF